jgi:SAM-dependent methyltransferase
MSRAAAGPSVSYERIAHCYEQVRGGDERARSLGQAVAEWLPAAALVADVGVGTGIVAGVLRGLGFAVAGFDLSPGMLAQAAERFPGAVARADAVALPLRDASVDAVVFVWVLHHVSDPGAAFGEAGRVLRRGGRIVAVSGAPEPRSDEMSALFQGLDTLRPERSLPVKLTEAASDAGLHVVGEAWATMEFDVSPVALAQQIEDRLYAPLWDLDDARWSSVVQPILDGLRSLDEPDEPRHRVARHPLYAFAP